MNEIVHLLNLGGVAKHLTWAYHDPNMSPLYKIRFPARKQFYWSGREEWAKPRFFVKQ